jgi:hypothetical protein
MPTPDRLRHHPRDFRLSHDANVARQYAPPRRRRQRTSPPEPLAAPLQLTAWQHSAARRAAAAAAAAQRSGNLTAWCTASRTEYYSSSWHEHLRHRVKQQRRRFRRHRCSGTALRDVRLYIAPATRKIPAFKTKYSHCSPYYVHKVC